MMSKGHGSVVGIALLDEHMAVEPAHLRDGKHTDAPEGTGLDRQDLPLGDIAAEVPVAVALETVEGDIAGGNIALQGAAGDVRPAPLRLQHSMLDELVLHRTVRAHLAGRGVAAVEGHKGVGLLAIVRSSDILVINGLGYGVVDVQEGHRIPGDAGADVLAERAVDIHFAGHGDASSGQSGIHITGFEAELAGERGPALVGEGHILSRTLMGFRPVQQS